MHAKYILQYFLAICTPIKVENGIIFDAFTFYLSSKWLFHIFNIASIHNYLNNLLSFLKVLDFKVILKIYLKFWHISAII